MDFETGNGDYPQAHGAPWWLDGADPDDGLWIAEADVLECPEMLAAVNDLGPMTVTERLLAASLVGAGAEAIRLLTSLRGQTLTGDQKLAVVQLWQPQLAWLTGPEQTAIVDLVGPAPERDDPKACLADEFAPLELAAALNATNGHATARIATARLLHTTLKATGARLRAGTWTPTGSG